LSYSPKAQKSLWATLEEAGRYDATVEISRSNFPRMLRQFVPPAPYSRQMLFGKMLAGEPSVLSGFPIPTRGPFHNLAAPEAGAAIINWLANCKNGERYRIFTGPTGQRREVAVREIALKWQAQRTLFGVTDLHIRQTIMEEIINPDRLSAFNVLCHSSPGARAQEMFSFVISSRGYVTDSHSDAPDSSNFCFAGKKLWLAWDTYEGTRRGLQDVERMAVPGQARFDMESWLSLRSARWFLVSPNDTLFLPANLTHKVITIEPYIGVGGFFVALPNCLRVLSHWITRGPLWSKRDSTGHSDPLIGEIAQSVRDAVLKLRGASRSERLKWGYDYLEQSARFFIKTCPAAQLRMLLSDPRFRCVADAVSAPWPLPVIRRSRSNVIQSSSVLGERIS
jgi:hypothetical protein